MVMESVLLCYPVNSLSWLCYQASINHPDSFSDLYRIIALFILFLNSACSADNVWLRLFFPGSLFFKPENKKRFYHMNCLGNSDFVLCWQETLRNKPLQYAGKTARALTCWHFALFPAKERPDMLVNLIVFFLFAHRSSYSLTPPMLYSFHEKLLILLFWK